MFALKSHYAREVNHAESVCEKDGKMYMRNGGFGFRQLLVCTNINMRETLEKTLEKTLS